MPDRRDLVVFLVSDRLAASRPLIWSPNSQSLKLAASIGTDIARASTIARSDWAAMPHTNAEGNHATRRQEQVQRQKKRKAEHIAEGYEHRGVSDSEAKRRAWATVNKESGGGRSWGVVVVIPSRTNRAIRGKKGGAASAHRSAAERSASAKKAAATRKRHAHSK